MTNPRHCFVYIVAERVLHKKAGVTDRYKQLYTDKHNHMTVLDDSGMECFEKPLVSLFSTGS